MDQLPEVLRRLLQIRGIADADLEGFLHPSLRDLADPADLPGVEAASRFILDALVARRPIVVFGDYDCDGVCATAILVKVLTDLATGLQSLDPKESATPGVPAVSAFIPERLTEGYGMSDASVTRMLEENPKASLVVTVDNGINSIEQVAALKDCGIDCVVTDHHLPSREMKADGSSGDVILPDAAVVVDPKVAAPKHLEDLCGAGVAFFLANRIVSDARMLGIYNGPKLGGPLLVLAGLATVTDIMPVLGQNRILVSEAIKNFRFCAPLGLQELHYRAARNARNDITARDFGFLLGPRINAAGRLASGMDALDLILETNRERVREYARRIDLNNAERKTIEMKMSEEALAKVVPGALAQVIDLPDGHPGVAGIVAARVMEHLGGTVPVCVIAGGHGSGRAPDGLNIRDAFVACADVLDSYGGHAAAGGFSVKKDENGKEMIDRFRQMLNAYCAKLAPADGAAKKPSLAEMWLKPEDITVELADALLTLEPFGEGNPDPIFGLHDVVFTDVKPLGQEGKHLVLMVGEPDAPKESRLRAIWWAHSCLVDELREHGAALHDICFTLTTSDYGEHHVELRLVSID